MAKVTKLKLARLTEGGEREYLATWSFGRKHVNNFSVQFQYYAETSRTKKIKKEKSTMFGLGLMVARAL